MSIEIVPLTDVDVPGAVECVQKVFVDDPYFLWAFNDPSKFNVQRNAASLTAHFKHCINCAEPIFIARVSHATGNQKTDREIQISPGTVVGLGWWHSPQTATKPQTWSIWAQGWLLSFRQLMNNIRFLGRGGLNVNRFWVWKQTQQAAHDALWTDSRGYYFCNIVAVSPQTRGMGIGKRLMQIVMDRADREGVPCYLESSKSYPNVSIYEKMGFELVKEIECVEGGDACKLYCMIRKPKIKI